MNVDRNFKSIRYFQVEIPENPRGRHAVRNLGLSRGDIVARVESADGNARLIASSGAHLSPPGYTRTRNIIEKRPRLNAAGTATGETDEVTRSEREFITTPLDEYLSELIAEGVLVELRPLAKGQPPSQQIAA